MSKSKPTNNTKRYLVSVGVVGLSCLSIYKVANTIRRYFRNRNRNRETEHEHEERDVSSDSALTVVTLDTPTNLRTNEYNVQYFGNTINTIMAGLALFTNQTKKQRSCSVMSLCQTTGKNKDHIQLTGLMPSTNNFVRYTTPWGDFSIYITSKNNKVDTLTCYTDDSYMYKFLSQYLLQFLNGCKDPEIVKLLEVDTSRRLYLPYSCEEITVEDFLEFDQDIYTVLISDYMSVHKSSNTTHDD